MTEREREKEERRMENGEGKEEDQIMNRGEKSERVNIEMIKERQTTFAKNKKTR